MAQLFTARLTSDGHVEIICDRETADLIAGAMEIVDPDDPDAGVWIHDCGWQLGILLEASPPILG